MKLVIKPPSDIKSRSITPHKDGSLTILITYTDGTIVTMEVNPKGESYITTNRTYTTIPDPDVSDGQKLLFF